MIRSSKTRLARFARALACAYLAGACFVGCAADEAEDAGGAGAAVVAGAPAVFERPEIGRIASCTGTLVAPKVVLSAAHCFDFVSGVRDVGDFVVDLPAGSRSVASAEVIVFGDETGSRDLALVRLAEKVPADVARPASLASLAPLARARVTMYGYGCTSRPIPIAPSLEGNIVTSGQADDKRKVSFPWGTVTRSACPGDSGGPVVDVAGAIVGVTSAYFKLPDDQGGGFDIFADPTARLAELDAVLQRWR